MSHRWSGDAVFDDSGAYRYRLDREWRSQGSRICWVMLNPSTADARHDDATIRRVMDFSASWGHSAATVVNLFAWRTTDPTNLRRVDDPVGPGNARAIAEAAETSTNVVVAWGNHGRMVNPHTGRPRCEEVVDLLDPYAGKTALLGMTSSGQPRHPLYLAATTGLTTFSHR